MLEVEGLVVEVGFPLSSGEDGSDRSGGDGSDLLPLRILMLMLSLPCCDFQIPGVADVACVCANTLPLHGQSTNGDMDLSGAVDALRLQAAVVDPRLNLGGLQGAVGVDGPRLTPAVYQSLVVPVAVLLGVEAVSVHLSRGHQRVNVGVAGVLDVDGVVHHHPHAHELVPEEPLDQGEALFRVQLNRDGRLPFPAHLGVLPLLGHLCRVP